MPRCDRCLGREKTKPTCQRPLPPLTDRFRLSPPREKHGACQIASYLAAPCKRDTTVYLTNRYGQFLILVSSYSGFYGPGFHVAIVGKDRFRTRHRAVCLGNRELVMMMLRLLGVVRTL